MQATSRNTVWSPVRYSGVVKLLSSRISGGRRVLGLSKALVIVKRYGKGVEVGISRERKVRGFSSRTNTSSLP